MSNEQIRKSDYEECLRYIENYWKQITRYHPNDKFVHFGLPNKFVCPNDGIYKDDQFYWDSYFTALGLVRSGRVALAKGMVDNIVFMQKRFNIIPMRNRFYNLGCSQPPFLTSMVEEIFTIDPDKQWRSRAMKAAEKELREYWMNQALPEVHIVHRGLSRYCDHFITHAAAEHESGWDMTSRFSQHCLDYLPVDLNSLLYKYEVDLAAYHKSTRNAKMQSLFASRAASRKETMQELMWDDSEGFYFDYDYRTEKRGDFASLAGFYPMWAGLASVDHAKKMVQALERFEYDYGIANSQKDGLASEYRQHDCPNGWPQQQWIVIKGLLNYGFRSDAERIAKKFLDLNAAVFRSTGQLWEKYNVVTGTVAESERYPTQAGFGWTNAVFLRLLAEFDAQKGA